MGAAYAHKVIHETHTFWYDLVKNRLGGEFGFELPQIETLRDVDADTRMVRTLSDPELMKMAGA